MQDFSYAQFQGGVNTDYLFGSYTIPGIGNLMGSRASFLQNNVDFQYAPPVITAVAVSNSSPVLNAAVDFTVNVTNTNSNSVYLGYRGELADRFTRVQMFDDGAHNDGASGDNVYGVAVNSEVADGFQSAMGVAVTNTDWIIQPSTRTSLTKAKTWIQMTLFTS